jgi:hypothetical protein
MLYDCKEKHLRAFIKWMAIAVVMVGAMAVSHHFSRTPQQQQ